jgi:hypothetical protein
MTIEFFGEKKGKSWPGAKYTSGGLRHSSYAKRVWLHNFLKGHFKIFTLQFFGSSDNSADKGVLQYKITLASEGVIFFKC